MNAEQKILKARTSLVLDYPFFGCLALRLKMIDNQLVLHYVESVESKKTKTALTDGKILLYNAEYIESLSNQEVTGLWAHVVMHIALGHTWRQGNRESRKWNIATDYTINYNLLGAGFVLPEDALFNPDYDDKSAEEIYQILPDEQQRDDDNFLPFSLPQGIDPGRCGAVIPTKGEKAAAKAKAETKATVNQALQVAKGNLPEYLKRQIQEVNGRTIK